ncbi:Sua5/YciO/YrdC/YwlC family protein [Chromohalobacter canadensis]|uniref:Threonylcarbamoyl-AMP synthase n=1 Tax=Chromohalobacter moromii TaxID=2860329 RepID=A0A9X2X0E4_9GAMM|nr:MULTISPECIES: Sua5/YciO/YrdC/YwlC family protein [Chromohalobacter]MCT8468383.1 Sua5/YciO/YrdC/YwlC family protein [Chromohalobacter canadensis]MCT8471438.1 Sua5/YciO/YrdC/YwlC family protein [Chromohalobacter canadensis]MCT8498891.1 Sua5/YciO/YrdC/YwlC family protein [Chromohalobacter canadensis]MCT8504784.1 Sua5/YciO/YrdC/YwlC family protein [Chromohalobacter moromii]
MSETSDTFSHAVAAMRRGAIVAYPTEAVWGLGCDPDDDAALARLIELKQRDPAKGLILIAGAVSQLAPWLEGLDEAQRARLAATNDTAPTTWLIPDNGRARPLLRGEHTTLAVRVSDHPPVQALCNAFGGPLVSTSANHAGEPPAMSADDIRAAFGDAVTLVDGALGGYERPSTIRDLTSGEVLRD